MMPSVAVAMFMLAIIFSVLTLLAHLAVLDAQRFSLPPTASWSLQERINKRGDRALLSLLCWVVFILTVTL